MLTKHVQILMLAAAMLLVACGPKKSVNEPSAQDFAPYIEAFSGGIVNAGTQIKVVLAEPASETPTEGLFRFKPAVEGAIQWDGQQTVCFIPADGALKEGQTYEATFALGKVIEGAPEIFNFGFTVKGTTETETPVQEEPDNGKSFRVVEVSLADAAVKVQLSEAPVNATVKGMVELKGAARSYVQVQENTLLVHYEGQTEDLTLTIDKGLKGESGNTLGDTFERVFKMKKEKPAVSFPFQGNILPDRQALILPFRAVNLSAVEVRVIKIYEKNILMFLQENDLGQDSGLRRCGRLVYRGDIALDATKNLHEWNTHCLDLSGLFRQEPGAIYRIRINFRLDQSLYGGKEVVQTLAKPSGKPSEADEAVWDTPNAYYWDNFYDWDNYNWKESDDP
nr:hypothetical protein [Bacteroidales bacterium]